MHFIIKSIKDPTCGSDFRYGRAEPVQNIWLEWFQPPGHSKCIGSLNKSFF